MRPPWGLVAGLAALAFLPALDGTFNYDDVATLLARPDDPAHPATWQGVLRHLTSPTGRPVFWATLFMDLRLWGYTPQGFHATSLLLHVVNALLLTDLAFRLSGCRRTATAAGLLLGIHPLAGAAACYISERTTLLATGFILAGLGALARLASGARPRTWGTTAAACWILGFLSKETAVMAPFLGLAVLPLLPDTPARRALRLGLRLACALAVAGGLAALIWHFGMPLSPERPARDAYALTSLRTFWRILALWTLPLHPAADADIPLSSGWLAPASTLAAALGLLGLLACLPRLARRAPWAAAGIAIALLALVPEQSVLVLQDPFQEHRAYLPMVGLALAAAPSLARLGLGPLLIPLALLLGAHRAALWRTEPGLWQANLRAAPTKLRVHSNLAQRYRRNGHPDAAARLILRASRIRPRPEQFRDLAWLAWEDGNPTAGLSALERAFALEPGRRDCLPLQGILLMEAGRVREGVEALERACAAWPRDEGLRARLERARAVLYSAP